MSKLLLFTLTHPLNPEPLDSASGSSGTFADFSMYITAEAAASAFDGYKCEASNLASVCCLRFTGQVHQLVHDGLATHECPTH